MDAPPAPLRSPLARQAVYLWCRMLRLRATPHEIALGCAAGVFAAFTPFLGLQMLIAGALALALRVNVPAALLGTFAGNPFSWPAIWGASYFAGAWMLGHDPALSAELMSESAAVLAAAAQDPNPVALDAAATTLVPHFKPLLAGSLLVGLIAAAMSYYPTRRAVRRFQTRRRLAMM
ncbi:MAG: DUF2062 domain-containing protein [Hyphomicrobium sp.]